MGGSYLTADGRHPMCLMCGKAMGENSSTHMHGCMVISVIRGEAESFWHRLSAEGVYLDNVTEHSVGSSIGLLHLLPLVAQPQRQRLELQVSVLPACTDGSTLQSISSCAVSFSRWSHYADASRGVTIILSNRQDEGAAKAGR